MTVAMIHREEKRILIWGKTYPELSTRHRETVCTGGVLEDGTPLRLYPIPFRYLEGEQRFKSYQWIRAEISRDRRDPRPESHRIEGSTIVCEDAVQVTSDEWGLRAATMFKDPQWQYASVEELWAKERQDGTSLGVVEPAEILGITIKDRGDEEKETFQEKLERLKKEDAGRQAQVDLFGEVPQEMKSLSYIPERLVVNWRCHGKNCGLHNMQILDWGTIELQRKLGMEKARERVLEICDLKKNALKFFLGNIKSHPTSFTIVGLWYPKRAEGRLF